MDNRLPQTSMAAMAAPPAHICSSKEGGNDLRECDHLRSRVQGSKVFLVGKLLTACDYKHKHVLGPLEADGYRVCSPSSTRQTNLRLGIDSSPITN
ncbi:hypothetical protein ACLB2K_060078 [Fragaria x ananassa]